MNEWQIYIEYLELDQKIYWIECDDERVMQIDKQEYEILKGVFDQLNTAGKFEKALRDRHNAYNPNIDCPEPKSPKIALDELLAEAELLGCSEREVMLKEQLEAAEEENEQLREAVGLLNSMILSGEKHSEISKAIVTEALKGK